MKISITAFVLTLGSLGCGVRSACVDVDTYFGAISSGTGEVDLGLTTRLECPKDVDTEIVIPSGAALTVKSGLDAESSVQFKNIRFTVEEGASLVFEMFVRFGPNSQEAYTHAFRVFEDASVTFMDKFRASKITSAFWNNGLVEFKKKSFFNNNNNVFYINSGTLKFRGSSTFKNNDYHGIENHSSGFVRFSKKATFIGNGATYDDTSGCGLENMGGTVIFRGDTLFADHKCKEAAALYNDGKMRFYGTTIFNDNVNEDVPGPGSGLGQGGGLRTWNGADTIFKGDVEFNRNTGDYGGGFGMAGGDITFRQAVSFIDNEATIAGGGFAAIAGNLTFEKEELVTRTGNSAATECPFGWQEDDATIFGFSEFICDEVN